MAAASSSSSSESSEVSLPRFPEEEEEGGPLDVARRSAAISLAISIQEIVNNVFFQTKFNE